MVTALTLHGDLRALLACPACRSPLREGAHSLECSICGADYAVESGIPILLAPSHEVQKGNQMAYFDDATDEEFEITRPFGTPLYHRFLLTEKFRRGSAGVAELIPSSTVLVVCGGSGMDAEFLAERGARVVTSDISLGATKRARERGRRHNASIDAIVADVEHLPYPDRSIDVVYVHDGLHHLERPLDGLAEMARVARHAVCVTEPARAAVTRLAVRLGLALEHENAGNRVARLALDDVRSTLAAHGFRIVTAERYAMYYRHEPGRAVRLFSRQPLLPLAESSLRIANALAGRLGNKLTVQAVREPE